MAGASGRQGRDERAGAFLAALDPPDASRNPHASLQGTRYDKIGSWLRRTPFPASLPGAVRGARGRLTLYRHRRAGLQQHAPQVQTASGLCRCGARDAPAIIDPGGGIRCRDAALEASQTANQARAERKSASPDHDHLGPSRNVDRITREALSVNPAPPLETFMRPDATNSLNAIPDVDESALREVLLAWLERSEGLLSVKEIGSGRYVHVNPRMAALLGRPPAEVIGLTDVDLMESGQWAQLRAADQSAAALGTPQVSEHRLERAGQRREFSVFRQVLPAVDGGAPRFLCSLWTELTDSRARDAQLQRALQQIENQQRVGEAMRREAPQGGPRDADTGLYQRVHFDDQLRREVDLSSREHREFALVSIILDPLPEKALSLGAAARTRVLEALGRLLSSNTRAMDASCRLDEARFAVLLSGVGLATAHSRMEGLRRQCATQIVMLDGHELGFTVSMGVASFPHTALSEAELLQASDSALDQARRRGGNHVKLASIRFEPA
jgi:diguanylate cyclase (GGDEF)-like protein